MYGCRIRLMLIAAVSAVVLLGFAQAAETWKLGEDKDWKEVEQTPQNKYLQAVRELKTIVNEGKTKEIEAAVEQLKSDYPKIAGKDLDLYVKGEKYYAAGKFTKAVNAYDNLMVKHPKSPLYGAALDREFSIGQAFLQGHKKRILGIFKMKSYASGIKVMDKVAARGGDSPIALKANLAVAKHYEEKKKYDDAYERWSQISHRWPTGENGKESLLAMARCKHAAYRGPDYDSSYLVSAKSYYENFRLRYPEDAKDYEIDKRIEQIIQQLSYKQYTIAEYYRRTGKDEPAKMYCRLVEEEWPDTTGAKAAKKVSDKIDAEAEKPKKPKKEGKWNLKKIFWP